MPINIKILRDEKSTDFLEFHKSHIARGKDVKDIEIAIKLDHSLRQVSFSIDSKRKEKNKKSLEIKNSMSEIKIEHIQHNDNTQLLQVKKDIENLQKEIDLLSKSKIDLDKNLQTLVNTFGNVIHSSVPISQDEKDNQVLRKWSEPREWKYAKFKPRHHHDLLKMIGGYEPIAGAKIAGHRGYFLKGQAVLLNQALINYGIAFLYKKNYVPIQPPFFMRKSIMQKTAQLEEFDESLYKICEDAQNVLPNTNDIDVNLEKDVKDNSQVTPQVSKDAKEKNESDPLYLIATSEQPISALHAGQTLNSKILPLKYAGTSSCFRKEAGAHGKDVWGIFRVHQFEKIEQFILSRPEKSWEMMEEMISTSEKFYQSLNLPYRVVSIVSGALNNAAAKKYDLEASFPTSGIYRELVSCSNCTDFQSRSLNIKVVEGKETPFVHLLNSTLTATERTLCCILENYQTDKGIVVPSVLQPFMLGIDFIPFV